MTEIIGPLRSEVRHEVSLGLGGIAGLLRQGVVTIRSTSTSLTHLAGIPIGGDLPPIGLARPSDDRRVDEDDPGFALAFSSHPAHQGDLAAVLEPGTLTACVACLADVLFDHQPALSDQDLEGLVTLIVTVSMLQVCAPIVSLSLDELAQSIGDAGTPP